MKLFLSGGAKSGKSHFAQEAAVALSGGGKRYYIATMIPSGEEDLERIRLHLLDREGMGFETVECFRNVLEILPAVDPEGTFLVDSVTSLLQNSLFPRENNYQMDENAALRCADELVALAEKVHHVVYVSDYIYDDGARYSETTERYRKCLAFIDRALAQVCDVVMEFSAGQPIVHKGEWNL